MLENIIKFIVAFSGAAASFLFGGWSVLVQVLLVMIVIDYLTGLLAAAYQGKLSSSIGFKGIAKKVMVLLLVAVAYHIDTVLGDNTLIRDAVIFFYVANELLSIIENAGKTGLPVPTVLTKAVDALNNKSKGEDK